MGATKDTQLTSVKVPITMWEAFQVAGIRHKFNFTKLTERAIFLYLTNEDFRKQIHNQLDTNYTGSV